MTTTDAPPKTVASPPEAAETVDHPFFSRVYPGFAIEADKRGQAAHRAELLADARGRVVELGAGTGRNFRHYPLAVTEVLAVEPEPRLRSLAEIEASRTSIRVSVLDGVASQLSLEDASCDVAVASLVLCSVPDQARALAELRRVTRPGGELRFYEHVVSPDPHLARAQRLIDLLFWPRIGGGCHCSRDTLAAIERAGFAVTTCRRLNFKPSPLIGLWTAPHVLGIALRV